MYCFKSESKFALTWINHHLCKLCFCILCHWAVIEDRSWEKIRTTLMSLRGRTYCPFSAGCYFYILPLPPHVLVYCRLLLLSSTAKQESLTGGYLVALCTHKLKRDAVSKETRRLAAGFVLCSRGGERISSSTPDHIRSCKWANAHIRQKCYTQYIYIDIFAWAASQLKSVTQTAHFQSVRQMLQGQLNKICLSFF